MADLSILDTPATYEQRDPGEMLRHIQALGAQTRDAFKAASVLDLPAAYRDATAIVITGMGGSAIGGALVAGIAEAVARVPIIVSRSYSLPAFVDNHTLVIASSYSGATEETLSAFDDAHQRGARLVAVTTGGALAERAESLGVPLYQFTYVSQPRAAVGFSFGALLGLLSQLGVIPDPSTDLREAEALLAAHTTQIGPDVPTTRNPAKRLAAEFMGDIPFIYGAEHLAAVARRWKTQLNENSKNWAAWDTLPEAAHNAIAGYAHPYIAPEDMFVVILDSRLYDPRVRAAIPPILDLLAQANVAEITVTARGESRLAQALALTQFGDYVSYYLALLNEVDPTPIPAISFLKSRLSAA